MLWRRLIRRTGEKRVPKVGASQQALRGAFPPQPEALPSKLEDIAGSPLRAQAGLIFLDRSIKAGVA